MNYPDLCSLVLNKGLITKGNVLLNILYSLVNITKALSVVPQRGTASLRTLSRILSLRPRSLTTSTLIFSNDSSSRIMAEWLSKVAPGRNSTRISRSLFESASPLATEPKILTLRAPCYAAISRISSRSLFRRSSIRISNYCRSKRSKLRSRGCIATTYFLRSAHGKMPFAPENDRLRPVRPPDSIAAGPDGTAHGRRPGKAAAGRKAS